MAYGLRRDSVRGSFPGTVTARADHLVVNAHAIRTFHHERPQRIPWADAGVDVLLLSVGPDLPYLTGYRAMPLERLTMLVLPRDGDAADVRWFRGPSRNTLHFLNATDRGNTITMELPVSDEERSPSQIKRWTFDMNSRNDSFGEEVVSVSNGVLARMDDRYIDLAHLFLGVVTAGEGPAFEILLGAGLEPKALIDQVKTIQRADARTTGRDLAGRAREVILELLELAPDLRGEDYRVLSQALETLAAELRGRATLEPPASEPPFSG